MDACLQDSAQLVENERRTLEWVRNKAATIEHLRDLYRFADESYRRFDARFGMDVYLTWEVAHGDSILDIHVGGLITLDGDRIDNLTYDLCIIQAIQDSEESRVLRRYHFDFANDRIRSTRRSAVFHLQSPGKLSPRMEGKYVADHMDAWLEEPRLFYFPMSLSLVLHTAFKEFPDEYTNRLCEDGEWMRWTPLVGRPNGLNKLELAARGTPLGPARPLQLFKLLMC